MTDAERKKISREEDADAIRRVLAGNKNAYTFLQNKYKNIINAIVRKVIRDEDDVDDLTQETFIKAYNALENFNFNYAFSSWLYKIASNACIDFLRKKRYYTISLSRPLDASKSDYVFEVEDVSNLPDVQLMGDEKTNAIQKAINDLPDKYREIIQLRHSEDMDYAEISEKLNLPLGTVKVNLFRARKMLAIALRKNPALFDINKTDS